MKTNKIITDMFNCKKLYVLSSLLLCAFVGVHAQSFGTDVPSAGFGSTSTMMGSGSAYSSTPTINSYGYAEGVGAIANRGRMAAPPDDDDEGGTVPVGDAVPFLLLLAAGYAFLARRKRA